MIGERNKTESSSDWLGSGCAGADDMMAARRILARLRPGRHGSHLIAAVNPRGRARGIDCRIRRFFRDNHQWEGACVSKCSGHCSYISALLWFSRLRFYLSPACWARDTRSLQRASPARAGSFPKARRTCVFPHVWYGTFAQDLGQMSPIFFTFNDRERAFTIVEAITGARMHPSWFRISGVAADLPKGWENQLLDFIKYLPPRLIEYDRTVNAESYFQIPHAGHRTLYRG
jgi:hypothetical protein